METGEDLADAQAATEAMMAAAASIAQDTAPDSAPAPSRRDARRSKEGRRTSAFETPEDLADACAATAAHAALTDPGAADAPAMAPAGAEEEAAATTVQAMMRGKAARAEAATMRNGDAGAGEGGEGGEGGGEEAS